MNSFIFIFFFYFYESVHPHVLVTGCTSDARKQARGY